jgi:hypothetical protein
MIRIILFLLLVYFSATLILALTMILVSFAESLIKRLGSKESAKTQATESVIQISSYAFGIALAATVITFIFSIISGSSSFSSLGIGLVSVFISVELIVMLLMLVRRSKNKLVAVIISILIFLAVQQTLLYFDFWGGLTLPFINTIQYLMMQTPVLSYVADSAFIIFLLLLIPAALLKKN